MAEVVDAAVSAEAMIGISGGLGGSASLGAKVRLSLIGEGNVMLNYLFMEESTFPNLEPRDPFHSVFDDIKKLLDISTSNTKQEGIRKSLTQFPR